MRRGLVILAVCALAGCANELAMRQAELAQWVGQPETELLQAMGAPDHSFTSGVVTVLTYDERDVDWQPVAPNYWAFAPSGWGRGFPPRAYVTECDTTFTIADGVVKSFSLRGNGCN